METHPFWDGGRRPQCRHFERGAVTDGVQHRGRLFRRLRAPNRLPPRHPRRTPVSWPAVIDGRAHVPIGEPGLRSSSNPLLEVAQAFKAATDLVLPLCALRDQGGLPPCRGVL
jgi:hypothetical protein